MMSRVEMTTRNAGNYFATLLCGILFLGACLSANHLWPFALGFEWLVTVFLGACGLIGFLSVGWKLLFPEILFFEVSPEMLRIKDLGTPRNFPKIYVEEEFPKSDVRRVHFDSTGDYSSFIEMNSGKKFKLGGEIFEKWPQIRELLQSQCPEIVLTEQ